MDNKVNSLKEERVIHIPENFAVEEAANFRNSMNKHIDFGEYIFLLDFSKCKFIDSTGLGVLVGAYKKCVEMGGSVRLKTLNENVMKVFKLTRLDKVFEIL